MATRTAWGHDGCGAYYSIKLTSCPRHRGAQMKRVTMPKITRHGGPTNFGLNDRDAGFVEPQLSPPADWVRPQNTADADLQAGAPAVDDPDRTADDDAVVERTEPTGDDAPATGPAKPSSRTAKASRK